MKLDASGNWLWGRRSGNGSGASARAVAVNAAHDSAVAGTSGAGALNLGTGALTCLGTCALVARLGP